MPTNIIEEINIENFKCFRGKFNLKLNGGLNILVGNNEAGKSTILEAIHLALTGLYNGRYVKNELTQYMFNNEVVAEYIENLTGDEASRSPLPHILIELFISGDDSARLMGDGNSEGRNSSCISLKIAFDDKYQSEYEEFVKGRREARTIPIHYCPVKIATLARPRFAPDIAAPASASGHQSSFSSQTAFLG